MLKQKRILAAVLVLTILCAAFLTGCGTGSKGEEDVKKPAATGSGDSGFNSSGMPIVKTPVTLKIIAPAHQRTDEYQTLKVFQELEKSSNVKIEWELIRSGWNEKKSLLLASNELPDAFFNKALTDSDIMGFNDSFLPMEDYIEKYAPNIKRMFAEEPDTKKISVAPNGHIYSLPHIMPLRPNTFDVTFINKSWMDKLGLKMPATTEEYYEVLKAFKEKDPNGNGKKDEIPLSFQGVGTGFGIRWIFGAFGVADDIAGNLLMVTNGKVEYVPVTDGYREGIKYLNKLYKEGLIDQEAFTQDYNKYKSKLFDAQPVIVGSSNHWTINAVCGKNDKEYAQLLPLKGPKGQQLWRSNPTYVRGGRNFFVMTKKNKYPEVTARWIDALYDQEISTQLYLGAIGVGIEKNSDGTYTIKEPPKEFTSFDAWVWKNSLGDSGPMYVGKEFEKKIVPNDWVKDKLAYDKALAPYLPKEVYPTIFWDKATSDELTILKADIGKYADEKFAKWIIDGGIDEEWDGYMNQLKKMGYEKLMSIYQQGYQNYNKK